MTVFILFFLTGSGNVSEFVSGLFKKCLNHAIPYDAVKFGELGKYLYSYNGEIKSGRLCYARKNLPPIYHVQGGNSRLLEGLGRTMGSLTAR